MDATSSGGRSVRPTSARRLSVDDWAQAALAAIAENGLAGVAVEQLAARLGATKGSFYWHFTDRQALIETALRLWEQEHTEAIIAQIETEPEPAERLRRLFRLVVGGFSRDDRIEVALLATANDPLVAPIMQRVTERRVSYVAGLFEELGMPEADARRRALLAVSVYLGHVQLAHAAPVILPVEPDQWRHHIDHMIAAILPRS